jgi:hypothetical protein
MDIFRWIQEADMGRELSIREAILKENNKTLSDSVETKSQPTQSISAKIKKPLVKWLY